MTELQHDPKTLGDLTEDELGIIRLLRHGRTEGAAERIAALVSPPVEPDEDDDLPPGRLAGNELSAEEEIALYVIGKLALEGIWRRDQIIDTSYQEIVRDAMAKAIREAIITFSADRATDLVTLVCYADPEITRRMVDEHYTKGDLP
jgi:hypothetical protein